LDDDDEESMNGKAEEGGYLVTLNKEKKSFHSVNSD